MPTQAIPVINSVPGMMQWRQNLQTVATLPPTPKIPWNFQVTSKQGGNYLTWQAVEGGDGYIVEISLNGDFSNGITQVNLPGINNIAYFDTAPTAQGVAPAKRYYRVRATAGTDFSPQSVIGLASGVVSNSAIAPNDTVTAPSRVLDTTTTDGTQTGTGTGPYISIPQL